MEFKETGTSEQQMGVTDDGISYVLRKPRYWNSVKQGFEWNKYNQVHYDSENPPPKVV